MKRHAAARRVLNVISVAATAIGVTVIATVPAVATPSDPPAPTVSASTLALPPAASTADPWAVRPYMGWSSYSMQVYSGNSKWITGDQLIKQSDAMHAKRQKYGYDYINGDAGWAGGLGATGR